MHGLFLGCAFVGFPGMERGERESGSGRVVNELGDPGEILGAFQPEFNQHGNEMCIRDRSKRDASRGGTVKIDNLSDDFHTYVMEWDKDSIKLMVDDLSLIHI